MDHFLTIISESTGIYKEKGSKFFSTAVPVSNEEEIQEYLRSARKSNPKANHVCYAFKLGVEGDNWKYNDDGEPSGTAGRPIYNQIEKLGLTNILVFVVRYFGGTKLGASGLIRAYREAAEAALSSASIEEKFLTEKLEIQCSYDHIGTIMNIISQLNLKIHDSRYEDKVYLHFEIRRSLLIDSIRNIKARFLNRPVEDIEENTLLEGIHFISEAL